VARPNGTEHSARERLTLELERLALRAARRVYDDLNATLFRDRLRAPAFELSDASGRLGRWVGGARTLELSRSLLVHHGWGVLVEVLKHEMAHQYVDEALGVRDEAAHGPEFRRVCGERGIDARAAGVPRAAGAEHDHVLERVAKLLALAQSSNEHEAQAAMSAAQRLMLKHNLEHVLAGQAKSFEFLHLGEPTGRVPPSERLLAAMLADHFFVEVIWVPVWRPLEGKRGSVLEVCGTRQNLELAAYVHAFIVETGERLWREYRGARRAPARERQRFLAGVVTGFRDKLEREQRKNRAEGLIWQGDAELGTFFRKRHPHVRYTRHASHTGGEAYARGREAGQRLVLHRGLREGPAGGPPRLLPARS
jgi:hypothetical protein